MKNSTKHYLGAFILWFGLLFLDGILSHQFESFFYSNQTSLNMIPRTLLMGIVMTVLLLPEKGGWLVLSLIIGFIYDSFYTGILGVYTFLFPAIVYLLLYIRVSIPHNALFTGLIEILSLTILESGVWMINAFLGLTRIGFVDFIAGTLWATVLLNIGLLLILYLPLKHLLVKMART